MRTRRSRRFLSFSARSSVETMEVRLLLSTFQQQGHEAIVAKYSAFGGKDGLLGKSTSVELVTTDGKGIYQYFWNGMITWSPATGAREVHGAIWKHYYKLGGPNGTLGLVYSDEVNNYDRDGRINSFQRGLIALYNSSGETSAVTGSIAEKYFKSGGSWGYLGVPVFNEIVGPNNLYRLSIFRGGIIVAAPATGIYVMKAEIANKYYYDMGGPKGILGLPTSDEITTPSKIERISTFQFGKIVYNVETGTVTAIPVLPATMDVLTPPTFREGDVFTATVMNGIPGRWAHVQVIGDGNVVQHQFPAMKVDANGNATFALRMPYVLASGKNLDGRTIRVVSGPVTENFPVTVHEGQRISISTDNIQEGRGLTVGVKNGVGAAQVIIQLTKDNNEVLHEWNDLQTDGSGSGNFGLTIPTVLTNGSRSDAFGLRVIHGGLVNEQRIIISEGFRIELGHQKTREGHTFPMGIRNAPEKANIRLEWYLDGSKRASQNNFKTDGGGSGEFTVTTPSVLRGGAEEDTSEIHIVVEGNSAEFVFKMLVKKQTSSPPDPGGSQVKAAGPTPNKVNSAPGVVFNTPTEQGKKNARIIEKKESVVHAAKDPELTIQERMKNQLVILCYGADQFPGKNAGSQNSDDRPGMDLVYENIDKVAGRSHVVRVRSGNKTSFPPKLPAVLAFEALQEAKKEIASAITLLNSSGQRIDSIVIAGYSWGGGMARELANWITNESTYPIEISGLIYVDAVNHGQIGHETDLPEKKPSSLLNIYQNIYHKKEGDEAALGDGRIPNPGLAGFDSAAYYGRYRDYDTDASGVDVTTHLTIDNRKAGEVAEFINGVLNGWYGAHRS